MDRPRITAALLDASDRSAAAIEAGHGCGKSFALAGHEVRHVILPPLPTLAAAAYACASALCQDEIGLAFAACALEALDGDAPRVYARWVAAFALHPVTVAVDDWDALDAAEGAAAFFAALVEETRARVRWLFAGRDLSALRARLTTGVLRVALDARALAFDAGELARYAATRGLSGDVLAQLDPRPAATALAGDLLLCGLPRREVAQAGTSLGGLVELAFVDADEHERRFLAFAAYIDTLDAELLAAFPLRDGPAVLARLRARLPSAFNATACAPWFRTELRRRVERDARYDGAVLGVIEAYERTGRSLDALRLALQGDAAAVGSIVARHAERFLDVGMPAEVMTALAERDLAWDDSTRAALRAIVAVHAGDSAAANRAFEDAVERADGSLRVALAQRFALELLRRGADAAALLEREAERAGTEAAAPLLATLATVYARDGRAQDAARLVEAAFRRGVPTPSPTVGARMDVQRAFVALHAGDDDEADAFAREALVSARAAHAPDVAARADTVIAAACYRGGETAAALAALGRAGRYAALQRDRALLQFVVGAAADIGARRTLTLTALAPG